ncbi:GntR family transcriptional regulator [Nocardia sp. NEAU-G5]|uniref:GntR family transcriptional regulator n=1 Tax=Nocardia albiluteola TaxID=2842303 RepID=A0ABS6AVV4_9NOCA|nr:GntR family transcriptional regulator [Nocardia albiluteola]MBU3062164.1 GntR family transcriptional regulator [Nocardia albiluteola]
MTGPTLTPAAASLDRELPLWYQVAQHLRTTIFGRGPGDPDRLPTEDELAAHYGVSVVTVRRALKALDEEGIIERRRRHGTFVTDRARSPRPPLTVLGTVDTVVAQQVSLEVEVVTREEVAVPPELAAHFPGADRLVHFRRLRSEHGEPISCADNWILPEHAAPITDEDLRAVPMTQALRERAGVRIERIENDVEARLATPELAGLLGVALLSPILLCACVVHDENGRVVDTARIHYRGDRFKYSVIIRADH